VTIHIIDYGVGNLGSVLRGFRRIGAPVELTCDPTKIAGSRLLVLPGVGHFGESMKNLRERGLEEPLKEAVRSGASLIGICVGFQMLFESSEEAPDEVGLGLLPGNVRRFPTGLTIPHIGWNQLEQIAASPLLEGIDNGDYFYFLHSFYVVASDEEVVRAKTEYGLTFCSVGERRRVFGIQFHPEKSQELGLRVLKNYWRTVA
jgi:glutamine amidotransferase